VQHTVISYVILVSRDNGGVTAKANRASNDEDRSNISMKIDESVRFLFIIFTGFIAFPSFIK